MSEYPLGLRENRVFLCNTVSRECGFDASQGRERSAMKSAWQLAILNLPTLGRKQKSHFSTRCEDFANSAIQLIDFIVFF
ncbi:hypothetical protein [Martelella radicis]|uniref:Uncharacterized protein n=1 Tax=Martelella radicis TaxID=1397476 RepID=A0A7W6KPX9_9HYPH|nr:hypothetical protein [Martelella radicis]MBB4123788.1 hypothetical protein [Martelella radicis]